MPTTKEPLHTYDILGSSYTAVPRRTLSDIEMDHVVNGDDVLHLVMYAADMCSAMNGPYSGDGGIVNAGGVWTVGEEIPNRLNIGGSEGASPWVYSAIFANYGVLHAAFAVGGPDGADWNDPRAQPKPLVWHSKLQRPMLDHYSRIAIMLEGAIHMGHDMLGLDG